MNLFKRWREQIEINHVAAKNSEKLLEELDRTEPDIEEQHREALHFLSTTETQARRLRAANHRNHYSEGLTESFRGRPAT
jgi:hypothetical protein